MEKPKVGISSCLLGYKVRHNGGDKKNDWLVDSLSKFVTWVPICPEVEMGLGVPRKTLHLTGKLKNPQLIEHTTNRNLSDLAYSTSANILSKTTVLDAYIFKKDSPLCGLERVKIYGKNNSPSRSAVGIFAIQVTEKFKNIPAIEEGRLTDTTQRELFVIKLFATFSFKQIQKKISALQNFHQNYKLLLMAYSPVNYQKLGKIAANPNQLSAKQVCEDYFELFVTTLNLQPSRKQWINVFHHMFGYFKTQLESDEKKFILEIFEEYRRGEIPRNSAITVLRQLSHKYKVKYLNDQTLFQPYPKSLQIFDN